MVQYALCQFLGQQEFFLRGVLEEMYIPLRGILNQLNPPPHKVKSNTLLLTKHYKLNILICTIHI